MPPRQHSLSDHTLVYAPCCPRDVYSALMRANWSIDQLTRLALVATSMASQGASSSLFLALTQPDVRGSSSGSSSSSSSSSSTGKESEELHALLQSKGGAVEALLPDVGGAHGIGTSVHLFPRARLLRAGVPLV